MNSLSHLLLSQDQLSPGSQVVSGGQAVPLAPQPAALVGLPRPALLAPGHTHVLPAAPAQVQRELGNLRGGGEGSGDRGGNVTKRDRRKWEQIPLFNSSCSSTLTSSSVPRPPFHTLLLHGPQILLRTYIQYIYLYMFLSLPSPIS